MKKQLKVFKELFSDIGPEEDLINMYLVFMGVRSACLISNINFFYSIPDKARLEIHHDRYPGRYKIAHPLVCLENSWVSEDIKKHHGQFTEPQLGSYLDYNCFNQDWKNIKIDRYAIGYFLITKGDKNLIYAEVCSKVPPPVLKMHINYKTKEMNAALKLINKNFNVISKIEKLPAIKPRPKSYN